MPEGPKKPTGLMNRAVIHTAAKLHYIENLPQIEVARRMDMSTATVSRLLARAREQGIVRFEVPPLEGLTGNDDTLAQALGLKQVRAIDMAHQPGLALAVGDLILEADLPKDPVFAIGWGRAVQGVVTHGLPAMANVTVVPATGGMNQSQAHFQINEFARTAAEQMGGTAHQLYAPARPSPALYEQLLRTPEIAEVTRLWDRVDITVTGIGNFPDTSAEHALGFSAQQKPRIRGDVVRQYYDAAGAAIEWPGQDCQMGMQRDQLGRVPLAIGVCIGEDKVDAIIGAARSGMINTLVTNSHTAKLVRDALGLS